MPRNETVFQVMVASPGDVSEERDLLEDVIVEVNRTWALRAGVRLDLVKWETHTFPGMGIDAQDVINDQIGDSYDIFLGILWTRFGTPTGRAESGTEEEFNRALTRFRRNPSSIRIMLYFKDAPIKPSQLNTKQLDLVNDFQQRARSQGAYTWAYSDTDKFTSQLKMHLSSQIHDYLEGKWGQALGRGDSAEADAVSSSEFGDSLVPSPDSSENTPGEGRTAGSDIEGLFDEENTPDLGEPGFIELIETFNQSFEAGTASAQRIARAIDQLGKRVQRRSQANQGKTINVQVMRRLADGVAKDMEQFCSQVAVELPAFASSYKSGIEAFGSAAILLPEIDPSNTATVEAALDQIISFSRTLEETKQVMASFQSTIQNLPPITSAFRRARTNTVQILERLQQEMSSGRELTGEMEILIREILPEADSTSNPS
jgi:hypothetical protein